MIDLENIATVPGRECGTCSLCCKVMQITELNKPQGVWCPNCDRAKGCRIYVDRPGECRTFICLFMTAADLPEHWRPSKSKMVLVPSTRPNRITAHLDPGSAGAWRQAPYYADLKDWATRAAPSGGQVCVQIGKRVIVILPDSETDLGVVTDEERVITRQVRTSAGVKYEALKLRFDDPRLAGAGPRPVVTPDGTA